MNKSIQPLFPIYIPSKGRSQYMMTSKALTDMGIRHHVIVEPQEVDRYAEASKGLLVNLLTLDMSFKAKYQTCDSLGLTKSTGSGPARNFAWEHAKSGGHAWHWVVDDNIRRFFRLNRNLKTPCRSPAFFRAMEDFVLRYENVGMAGPHYEMFAPRKNKVPPFICNTRVYSCNLIRTDLPHRWRGRYNEDTILSLDILKSGWCTILFYAFLQHKIQTQKMRGGNTDELYEGDKKRKGAKYSDRGTVAKSRMLAIVHPDVARVTWRFGRVHHYVDYSPFKSLKLIRRADLRVPEGVNNYGMKFIKA